LARRLIVFLTNLGLVLAMVFAVGWLWTGSNKMEAAATVTALFAAITGVRAERWAAIREQRKRVLDALGQELERNQENLDDERFRPLHGPSVRRRVFPRLSLSAVDAALTSGTLETTADAELVSMLYQWRDAVRELNHRLDLTEVYLFSADTIEPYELEAFDEALHSPDGILDLVSALLVTLKELVKNDRPQATV
jgi:hypothetical protein